MKFFPERPDKSPKIYCYSENRPEYKGLIRIGYTAGSVKKRVSDQFPSQGPKGIERYKILLEESSMRDDGTFFLDHEVHKVLKSAGIQRVGGEWFKCSLENVKAAIIAVKERKNLQFTRTENFILRPEQVHAIEKTKNYFKSYKKEEDRTPHFLWNCKMRFGKTFAAYKLAERMKWKKVLVLTFKPAVQDAWRSDLESHIDFSDWQFLSNDTHEYNAIKKSKPFVGFYSFQDFLGKNKSGGIKIKNEWAHKVKWDCIILDEYHYGAWRESARELYAFEDIKEQKESINIVEEWNEEISPLTTDHYLYLSGTPFRAIESGEFIEEQIFNWTYTDEQSAKINWDKDKNPYESLPRMVMMLYEMPDSFSEIIDKGEFDEFDLNEFFKAEGEGEYAKFKYEDYVQKWLDLIRGAGIENIYNNLKIKSKDTLFPFQSAKLVNILTHTLWFLPSVPSCHAMYNLMSKASNYFYHDYKINVCAGNKAGIGLKALDPVTASMSNPLKSKTITLSCGKLTTGVTVKPWTGVMMLRNSKTPETYFQTAFRVQSPWTIKNEDNTQPNNELVLKKECYVFDFAPNRSLKRLTDYTSRLDIENGSHLSRVEEFIKFLPIVCFNGSSMIELKAEDVLEIGISGTSGSLLAKGFQSTLLINVDNNTLNKILNNQKVLDIIMKIEGFRKVNTEIESIINKSEKINELQVKSTETELSSAEKNILTKEKKERQSLRQKLQEKLLQFASSIPIFMYLTDYREETLEDVIRFFEPDLFRKVTSLTQREFNELMSVGLFNKTLWNAVVLKFKRYENESLHYDGYTKHNKEDIRIGLFNTTMSAEEFHG
tara:strand:+ start:3447 stop:5930 length:2484 start_codon:yes stop_codon:yes gene_type:complete